MTPPLCDCHGEPKLWATDARDPAGGYWRCRVKQYAAVTRYMGTPKGRAARRRERLNTRTQERAARIQRRQQELT